MTKFARPKARFDNKLANDGVWFYPTDENGTEYGGFKLALVDKQLPRYRIALERLQRQYGNKNGRVTKIDETFAAKLFVEIALVDWDVKDEAGKSVPFTKENATEYFTLKERDDITGEDVLVFGWALSWLDERSQEIRHYQPEEQTDVPEKN